MPYRLDDTRHPLVVVTFEGQLTDDEMTKYLEDMETRVLGRRMPYAVVVDATRSRGIDARQRRIQADWLRRHEAEIRRFNRGTAFVITSPIVRGALTAIFWIQPLPSPHVVVSTFDQAEAWCRAQLAGAARANDF